MLGIIYLALITFGGMVVLGLCGLAAEKLCEAGYFQNLFGKDYEEEPMPCPSHKQAGERAARGFEH